MGDVCTRNCGFCNMKTGRPFALDENEPDRVAEAVKDLGIKYAVITSVTRDDLEDGGALHFANTIKSIRKLNPDTKVEILTPDFKGNVDAIKTVLEAKPNVFGHNMEVVKEFHSRVKKPPSSYDASINFLKKIKEIEPSSITKTGVIVGVGENKSDVFRFIDDVAEAKLDVLTIGQYLTPTKSHSPVVRYATLEEFAEYEEYGKKAGLKVFAGPLVRSSYRARMIYDSICNPLN
jgi:lipoic acid synthetase